MLSNHQPKPQFKAVKADLLPSEVEILNLIEEEFVPLQKQLRATPPSNRKPTNWVASNKAKSATVYFKSQPSDDIKCLLLAHGVEVGVNPEVTSSPLEQVQALGVSISKVKKLGFLDRIAAAQDALKKMII